ncbi:MAG TPA: hypothetical protein VGD84_22180 [Pseudonocardiaceae bacterium]
MRVILDGAHQSVNRAGINALQAGGVAVINFSDNSVNHNRELGVIINDTSVLSGVESAFTADFNHTPSGGT